MQDDLNSTGNANFCSAVAECPTCEAPGLVDPGGTPATLKRCYSCGGYFVAWSCLSLRHAIFGIETYPADPERSQFIIGLMGNGVEPTDEQFIWCMVASDDA